MHKLYELKEMLCAELEKYGSKELTAGSLEVVDKLAHAVKNLDKILETYEEEEYSQAGGGSGQSRRGGGSSYRRGGGSSRRGGSSYEGGSSYDGGSSYEMDGGSSYARGRGRNARRDSMGRYSSAGDEIAMELKELMQDAPDQQTRQDIQRIVQRLEQM